VLYGFEGDYRVKSSFVKKVDREHRAGKLRLPVVNAFLLSSFRGGILDSEASPSRRLRWSMNRMLKLRLIK